MNKQTSIYILKVISNDSSSDEDYEDVPLPGEYISLHGGTKNIIFADLHTSKVDVRYDQRKLKKNGIVTEILTYKLDPGGWKI